MNLSKEVYDVRADKKRVQLIVNAIKSRRDIEFKELAEKFIPAEQSLEQKVLQRRQATADNSTKIASGSGNLDQRAAASLDRDRNTIQDTINKDLKSRKIILPSKRMGLLPLGFGHLRIPYGGKDYQAKRNDIGEEPNRIFDPVDCSLLLEDQQGIQGAKELKKRTEKLDKERAKRYLVSMGLSKAVPPSHSPDAIKRQQEYQEKKATLLNPQFVQKLANQALDSLCQNNPIFWSMEAKVDFKKLSSSIEKPPQKPKLHRGNVLFELLKQSPASGPKKAHFQSNTNRDLKLDRDGQLAYNTQQLRKPAADKGPYDVGSQLLTTKSLSSLGNTLQAYQTTLTEGLGRQPKQAKPHSLRFQMVDVRAAEESDRRPAKVDVNRLPYLYISPSI